MKPRPRIVTFVAWLFILSAVFQLFKMPVDWRSPDFQKTLVGGPVGADLHFGIVYVGYLLQVVAGALIVSGRKVGRLLLAAAVLIWRGYDLYYDRLSPGSIQLAIVLVIATLFVFRSNATAFFDWMESLRKMGRHRQG
jgi:hypothetical protein